MSAHLAPVRQPTRAETIGTATGTRCQRRSPMHRAGLAPWTPAARASEMPDFTPPNHLCCGPPFQETDMVADSNSQIAWHRAQIKKHRDTLKHLETARFSFGEIAGSKTIDQTQ